MAAWGYEFYLLVLKVSLIKNHDSREIICAKLDSLLFSLLLQNGEELGMEKDRLMLLDETVVPASLTQLREVT